MAIRRHSAQYAAAGPIAVRAKRRLYVARPISTMGPAHRIRLIGSSDVLPRAVDRYIKDAAHDNLLKQVKGSLPGMASYFRCYAAFCELRKVTPSPARGELAIRRSSMFNNAATFGG